MRVRTSADSIRNMERLLAFDEAAGSKRTWPDGDSAVRVQYANHEQSSILTGEARPAHTRRSPLPASQGLGPAAMVDHF